MVEHDASPCHKACLTRTRQDKAAAAGDVSMAETPLERSFRFANSELEKKTAKMIMHVYNDAKKEHCQPGHFRRVGSPLLLAIA